MTPVPDDLLSTSVKTFVVALGQQTVTDALRALRQKNGDDEWFLVVELKEDEFFAARFSQIRAQVKAEGPEVLTTPLENLGAPLVPVGAVDQHLSLADARKRAEHSPTGIVVVTWGDAVVGVLDTGQVPRPVAPAPRRGDVAVHEESDFDVSVQVADDVMGDVIVAGDDVIIQAREEEPTTLLGRVIDWAQANPILTVLSFFLTVALPTSWFIVTEVVPTLTTVEVMMGEFNVAVAGFTPVGGESVSRAEVNQIGTVFFNRLSSEFEEFSAEADIVIDVWGPDVTGVVKGNTPEARAENAEKLAQRIRADILIYGTVQREGDVLQLQPEFYVGIVNAYEAEEIVGQHALGNAITLTGGGGNLGSQLSANRELNNRAQALTFTTRGLVLYFANDFEAALLEFQSANQDDLWFSDRGREVLYLFEGNAAGRADMLDEAETAFKAALGIRDDYARAYVGLASIYYLRSLENVSVDGSTPDEESLKLAIDTYQKALEAEYQPPTADIPTRVSAGLGQVYLLQWLFGQDTVELATQHFERVIDAYGNGENPRVAIGAANAEGFLGLIAAKQQNYPEALRHYENALELSTVPERRGMYWFRVGEISLELDQADEADQAFEHSVEQYKAALSLTSLDELRAEYYAMLGANYSRLDRTDEAVNALGQAIELLPEESETRTLYQSQLDELRD